MVCVIAKAASRQKAADAPAADLVAAQRAVRAMTEIAADVWAEGSETAMETTRVRRLTRAPMAVVLVAETKVVDVSAAQITAAGASAEPKVEAADAADSEAANLQS